jgi:hypothetical protein
MMMEMDCGMGWEYWKGRAGQGRAGQSRSNEKDIFEVLRVQLV